MYDNVVVLFLKERHVVNKYKWHQQDCTLHVKGGVFKYYFPSGVAFCGTFFLRKHFLRIVEKSAKIRTHKNFMPHGGIKKAALPT